jgi:hypothetical protein
MKEELRISLVLVGGWLLIVSLAIIAWIVTNYEQ